MVPGYTRAEFPALFIGLSSGALGGFPPGQRMDPLLTANISKGGNDIKQEKRKKQQQRH